MWVRDVAIEGADIFSSLALSPPGLVDLWTSNDNRDFFTSSTFECMRPSLFYNQICQILPELYGVSFTFYTCFVVRYCSISNQIHKVISSYFCIIPHHVEFWSELLGQYSLWFHWLSNLVFSFFHFLVSPR